MPRPKKPLKPRSLFASPVPKAVEKPKVKWRVLPIMWMALKRGAMLLGFMLILSSMISLFTLGALVDKQKPVMPDRSALYIDFKEPIAEIPEDPSLSVPFPMEQPTLRQYVMAIERAKHDDRISGIVARMRDGVGFSLAQAQELRNAIKSFRESGKFTSIYSSSFGGSGGGLSRYYLASSFDEMWMQPLGVVGIAGINLEMPFFRGTLDKIGVTPDFFQKQEYKTAYESFTNAQMSPENREMMELLVSDLKSELVSGIAENRAMSEAEFTALVNEGLFTAEEALAANLIDKIDYADVLLDKIRADVTGNPDADESEDVLLSLRDYIEFTGKPAKGVKTVKPNVALVYIVGAIMHGSNLEAKSSSVFLNDGIATSNVIAPAIFDAAEREDIDTIILRVDSPGGSPSASEAILRAVEKAKEDGKTVIVSMGGTAASGGYWVSAYADRIFASPMTITGSIGVVGGKFVLRDFWEKIGANWDSVNWGENADMWSMNSTFDASAEKQVNEMLDNVYSNFI
ncbi:MAG: S49 family peptidase, partial [Alphaproteobacteria bacterium]